LYRGEQYDSDLGLYYLRARYYNPATGRFLSRDPEDGKPIDPKTLHKYLYAGGDPVNGRDPSGRASFEQYLVQVNLDTFMGIESTTIMRTLFLDILKCLDFELVLQPTEDAAWEFCLEGVLD
jgi:RHS repeat-associated protein